MAGPGADRSPTLLWRELANGPKPGGYRRRRCAIVSRTPAWSCCATGSRARTRSGAAAIRARTAILSIAAHAHADALSIELRCGGVEVLVDPGTYTYQGEPEWRTYFRSTIGHNCLELGGEDQSVAGGPSCGSGGGSSEVATSGPRRRSEGGLARNARRLSAAVARRPARTHGHPPSRSAPARRGGCRGQHRPTRLPTGVPHRTGGRLLSRRLSGSAQLADQCGAMARVDAAAQALEWSAVRGQTGPAARMVFAMLRRQAADRDAGRAKG